MAILEFTETWHHRHDLSEKGEVMACHYIIKLFHYQTNHLAKKKRPRQNVADNLGRATRLKVGEY